MIWEKPIHASRPIRDWLDHSDTGFQPKLIELIGRCSPAELQDSPYQMSKGSPIIMFDDMSSIKDVCALIKAFSTFADIAMWCDGTKFPRNPGREQVMCEWTESDIYTSYKTADLLVISNIPDNSSETASRNHRSDLDKIINSRQQRHRSLTIIIGPNHTSLSSLIQYIQIQRALNDE